MYSAILSNLTKLSISTATLANNPAVVGSSVAPDNYSNAYDNEILASSPCAIEIDDGSSIILYLSDIDDGTDRAVSRKAAGSNCVPAEFYKGSPNARKILLYLCNIWHRVPAWFADGNIPLTYEKGNNMSLDSYSLISLLNANLKILTSILARRIYRLVGQKVLAEQFTVTPRHQIVDCIFKIQAAC
ncbi:hypothetical protein GGH96_001406 [Coemansia sp. RSA 1972]|nr:hypothetical protein GGH96_001406 [Coemansia sp. RSA 1972]